MLTSHPYGGKGRHALQVIRGHLGSLHGEIRVLGQRQTTVGKRRLLDLPRAKASPRLLLRWGQYARFTTSEDFINTGRNDPPAERPSGR